MTLPLRETMLRAFQDANPGLALGGVPGPGQSGFVPRSTLPERVLQAGGETAAQFLHPTFLPFETLFRKFPAEGVYTATPQSNFILELGSITVPPQMVLALADYRFDLYRFSGAAAGDWVPIEERRLSGYIGYDVQTSAARSAQLLMQIQPTPPIAAQQAYERQRTAGLIAAGAEFNDNMPAQIGNVPFPPSAPPFNATVSDFANARAASVASPGTSGLSTLPQRHERYGAPNLPFTLFVRERQFVQFRAIVFRPVPLPIAFFEVDATGILMPANVADSLLKGLAPYAPQGEP